MKKHEAGDIFVIPMHDGSYAFCQVICALRGRFKKVFSFGVMGLVADKEIPNDISEWNDSLLTFVNSRGSMRVIFAATDNLRSGDWEIVGHIPLTTEKEALQEFQSAGHLYHGDEWIRNLTPAEYKLYNTMGVAGNELVQQYLAQH